MAAESPPKRAAPTLNEALSPLSRRGHRASASSEANVGPNGGTSVPCAEATLAARSVHRSQGGARPDRKSSCLNCSEITNRVAVICLNQRGYITQICLL